MGVGGYTISNNDELLEALHPVPNFKNKDDIKPWLHGRLDARGICLVIERSDASKVVLKCKNIHRKSSAPKTPHTKLANGKTKRVRSQPEECCPFRLRLSYSVKHKQWSVTVIKSEHNLAICSNFGSYKGSATSTPSNRSTTKRSFASAYTPASTASPMMSVDGSPSCILTPASELDGFEFERYSKKRHYESPLNQIVNPLDDLTLPEDLSDLNYLDDNSLHRYDDTVHFAPNFHFAQDVDHQHVLDLDSDKLFEMNLESKVSELFDDESLFNKVYNSSSFDTHSLNINSDVQSEDPDSLMYLLSTSSSNYSLEELENLDKAMGVDVNDKLLLSMFHPKA